MRCSPPASGSRSIPGPRRVDRKSTRLNSSHSQISYAVFCLKKKKIKQTFSDIQNVLRKLTAFHDEAYRLSVDALNIICYDGGTLLIRSSKARLSYIGQRAFN